MPHRPETDHRSYLQRQSALLAQLRQQAFGPYATAAIYGAAGARAAAAAAAAAATAAGASEGEFSGGDFGGPAAATAADDPFAADLGGGGGASAAGGDASSGGVAAAIAAAAMRLGAGLPGAEAFAQSGYGQVPMGSADIYGQLSDRNSFVVRVLRYPRSLPSPARDKTLLRCLRAVTDCKW